MLSASKHVGLFAPWLMLAVVLTVLVGALGSHPAGTHASAATTKSALKPSLAVNGHDVSRVLLNGHLVSYSTYRTSIEPAANAKHQPLTLVVDSSAVARGYFVAFSSTAAANKYMAAHNMMPGTSALSAAAGNAQRAKDAVAANSQTLNGQSVQLAACSVGSFAVMYDGTNCTGQSLSMLAKDIINNFGVYNFNDKASSLSLGTCIVQMRMFLDVNLTGTVTVFGGGGQTYSAISNSNSASSATTPGTNC
jgi:hypothetical protein